MLDLATDPFRGPFRCVFRQSGQVNPLEPLVVDLQARREVIMGAQKSISEGVKVNHGRATDQARLQERDTVCCFHCRRKFPAGLRSDATGVLPVNWSTCYESPRAAEPPTRDA